MKSKIALLCLPLFLLVSCSTPYELRKTSPKVSYVTARPAEDVVECISSNWEEHLSQVSTEKTDSGWLIRHNDVFPAATVVIATVEGTSPNVEVKYYHRTNRIKLHRTQEEVESCK